MLYRLRAIFAGQDNDCTYPPGPSHLLQDDRATPLNAGDVIVVIDAGGGTTDVTAHVVEMRGGTGGETVLAEAMANGGGFCGSTYIDAAFETIYRNMVRGHAVGFTDKDTPVVKVVVLQSGTHCRHSSHGTQNRCCRGSRQVH